MNDDDEYIAEPGLMNIIEQKSLKWIFVGGKGGVGKTTTSTSLAIALSKHRNNVLIISTDPAHNLSDAFGQKITKDPTKINGFDNLSAMEIDPKIEIPTDDTTLDNNTTNFIQEMAQSIPGIDEAMSFAELMKQVQTMNFDVIVFDTAPTGHTLRLLSFPQLLQKGFVKLMSFKQRFSGLLNQFQAMMGPNPNLNEEAVLSKLEQTKTIIDEIHKQFQDPNLTTFVCVCIPEFLSLFETERLVQELAKFGIDTHNVVVNQVLHRDKNNECKKCVSREKMQKKYLDQIVDLYFDFNVTVMPQLDEEVRGVNGLDKFSNLLLNPPSPPQ